NVTEPPWPKVASKPTRSRIRLSSLSTAGGAVLLREPYFGRPCPTVLFVVPVLPPRTQERIMMEFLAKRRLAHWVNKPWAIMADAGDISHTVDREFERGELLGALLVRCPWPGVARGRSRKKLPGNLAAILRTLPRTLVPSPKFSS